MTPSRFGWPRKRQSGPVRKEATLYLEQFNDRSMLGSMWSLRPSALVVGGGLLNRWFNPIDAAGEEPASGANVDFPSGWDSISPSWKAEPENGPNDGLDIISLVSANPPLADSRPTTQLPPGASAAESSPSDTADNLGDVWSPDQDRLAFIAGLSMPGSAAASGVDGTSSGGTQAPTSTEGPAPSAGPVAGAAGASSSALAPPTGGGRGVTALTASSPGVTNPATTPTAVPPSMAGATNIQSPDVTGQMQELLHQARQLDHSLSGKDGGSFRSQLDRLGGSSDFLGNLVHSFHKDAGSSVLGPGKSVTGGKVHSLVNITPATLKGQGIFAPEVPHLTSRFHALAGAKNPGAGPAANMPGELAPNDPSMHEEDTSAYSFHETGANANASFTLDENITLTITVDAQWIDGNPASFTLDDSATITFHFVETGSINVDQSGTNTFSDHATDQTAPDGPDSAIFDLDRYNQTQFWNGTIWDTTVSDLSNGHETLTVHEIGNEATNLGTLSYTADEFSPDSFTAHEPSAHGASFTEHMGGSDSFSLYAIDVGNYADGTDRHLTLHDNTSDTFIDNGNGPDDGPASFTDHVDGPQTFVLHETGSFLDDSNQVQNYTIDDTTPEGYTDNDHGTDEPNDTIDSQVDTQDATGSDSFTVTVTGAQTVDTITLSTTVVDHSADSFTIDDQITENPGDVGDTDNLAVSDTTGADTFTVHETGSGPMPDGTAVSLTVDDYSTDSFTDEEDPHYTDLNDTTGTDSYTDWAGGSDTFGIHETGAKTAAGFTTDLALDDTAADSFTTTDNGNYPLSSPVFPDTYTDNTSGSETLTDHGTRISDDASGNSLHYTVDDMTSDSFSSDDHGQAMVSSNGSETGTDTLVDHADGHDTFTVQEIGTTIDGAANVSFSVGDNSYDSFTDDTHGSEDFAALNGSNTFTDYANGTDSATAHEHGTSSDAASGDNIDFTIDDNSNDSFTREDSGADSPTISSDDLSVDTQGHDSFTLRDSGLTHTTVHDSIDNTDYSVPANFADTDQSRDSFVVDDHATTADSTDRLDDQANGTDTVSVHETGSLAFGSLNLGFTLDDNANDSYSADDLATKPLGSPSGSTDTYTNMDHGNDTIILHEPGSTYDGYNSLVSFSFGENGGGHFDGGAAEVTANGTFTSALHSFTSDDHGNDTYTAHDEGNHDGVTYTWDETAYDSFTNHEARGNNGNDTLIHDASGLASYSRHETGPASPDPLYLYPGTFTNDLQGMDSFTDHDVTIDSGATYTEQHTHDTTASTEPHDVTIWDYTTDNGQGNWTRFHASHDDRFMEQFGSHEEKSLTVVNGVPTDNMDTGREDESGTASVTEDVNYSQNAPWYQAPYSRTLSTESTETYAKHRDLGDNPTQTWNQSGTFTKFDNFLHESGEMDSYGNTDANATYTYHEVDAGPPDDRQVTAVTFDAHYADDGSYPRLTKNSETSTHETGSGSTFVVTDTWGGHYNSTPPNPYTDYDYDPTTVTSTYSTPTGPDPVQVPAPLRPPAQRAFGFAAGTLNPNQLLVPNHPPPQQHEAGSGVAPSWWDKLTDDLAGRFVDALDNATGGLSTKVLTSKAFGTALDTTDQFFAGYGDSLTGGLSTRARTAMWGQTAAKNHQGSIFEVGKAVGTVHSVALAFVNPCGAAAVVKYGIKGVNIVQAVGGSTNAYEAFKQGNYAEASLEALNVIGNFATILKACFAAGTPLLTPTGDKLIETFVPGDLILARSESDPNGPLEAKVVEEVYVRTGRIVHLHVGGHVIKTTSEHPFFVYNRGWLAAAELQLGHLLVSHDDQLVPVEGVLDTGEYATVYNLAVADFHTYFVGTREWPFSVWAHNRKCSAHVEAVEGRKNTYDIVTYYKKGWNNVQRKAADAKVDALTKARGKKVVHNPARSGRSQKEFRKTNKVAPTQDADHIVDLQLGGKDLVSNVWALNSSVNRSLGAQIMNAIKNLNDGDKIRKVIIRVIP